MGIYYKVFIFEGSICLIKSLSLDAIEYLILSPALCYKKRKKQQT